MWLLLPRIACGLVKGTLGCMDCTLWHAARKQSSCLCTTTPVHPSRWEQRRKETLARLAPGFLQHGNKTLMDCLIRSAVEGNAWHADHIIPVYKVRREGAAAWTLALDSWRRRVRLRSRTWRCSASGNLLLSTSSQGGGGCGIENLRTLCVLCHKKVTADQARARAAERRRRSESTG